MIQICPFFLYNLYGGMSMDRRRTHSPVRIYNFIVFCLALLAIFGLFIRAHLVHFEYPDGNDVHVLSSNVTVTADDTGEKILFHGRLPQYFPVGAIETGNPNRIHLEVELEDLHDSDELLIEVWNSNMEAYLDGRLIGTFIDGNPIHSLSSYYYTIPMDAEDNGKMLTLDYWRDRKADIPWTFPAIRIGTSSELFHHVYFPYRLMLILGSALLYSSFTLIVCFVFYRNRPGIQSIIYSFILLLLGTFQIIAACPASAMVNGSNLASSILGQVGVTAFPIFLYLYYREDGTIRRNPFFFLISFAHLMLGFVDMVLLLFDIGSSELDIFLYISTTLYLIAFFGYGIYLVLTHRQRVVKMDFATLLLFTLSSCYLSYLIISGNRHILSLYAFTILIVVGLSICSYKTIIALTRHNVALLKNKTLEEKSLKDVLTGLENRRGLEKTFDSIEIPEEGVGIGISYFDLDGMKKCNDTFGHEAGDRMLRTFASSSQIDSGVTFRIGGDEFVKVSFVSGQEELDSMIDAITRDFSYHMDGIFSATGSGCFRIVHSRTELPEMVEEAECGMRAVREKRKGAGR